MNKKENLCLALLLVLISTTAAASIQSGRPGQSIGAGILAQGYFQVQSGVDQTYASNELSDVTTSLISNVLRLGLNERFEISAVLNYQNESLGNSTSTDINGVNSLQLGFRSSVVSKQQGLLPQMALQTRFRLKGVSSEFEQKNMVPVFILSTIHSFLSSYSLTTNLGLNLDGDGGKTSEFWTLNFAKSVSAESSIFAEIYGNTQDQKSNVYFDTGVEYIWSDNLKFDFSTGWGKNNSIEEFFVSFGVSARTKFF